MHQSTNTHRPAKDLSPEEIKEYRKRLDKHLQSRKVDEALLQRAWHTAHKIAAMLYEDFGAAQVAVFGALAQQNWFSEWSDIDIAVWGLPKDQYFHAIWQAEEISGLFKVNLVDFESCGASYQERINRQNNKIEKGIIYQIDRMQLIQNICNERLKIDNSFQSLEDALEMLETAADLYRREIEITIGKYLADCYMGIEYIFKQIALDVDLRLPDGIRWNKELLEQMTQPNDERPPVISKKTSEELQEYLVYHHHYYDVPSNEQDFEKTKHKAKQIGDVFYNLNIELDTFIEFLNKEND